MKVSIQIIEVYEVDVDAKTYEEAITKVYGMNSIEIRDNGKLVEISTGYAEISD